ncbi:MAG: LptF/LptG family permease [Drouetiella hepatica Uher 2000/2452]|uniref:LptF/LptG family permease n=1 Tax=Drouetiella hepatica Uher 2000/2452 TaxID=904376 RepID=A0A951QES8_9CYAN|nr:LptF/LptG family permease [Drouetiella hepatica Uher 2000/2452]
MDRYIATELILPFLFGVGAFSSLGVSVGALFDLIRQVTESGLAASIAAQVFLLKFPEFVVYAFPMSTLLANLMAYSRLSSDSELTALKACGISLYRMLVPALALCLVVTGLTFAFNELIVPKANYQATQILEKALNEEKPSFQEQNILYQEYKKVEQENGDSIDQMSRLFYAKRFDGQQMQGLTILDFSQEGLSQIVSAKSAAWNGNKNIWDFFDGTIYVVAADGSYRNIVTFKNQQLQLPREPLDLASKRRDYNEMNIAQAEEYLTLLQKGGSEDKIQKLKVRIQQKYALPFVCLSFGLVGAALGAKLSRRTGRATGFAISIIIIFAYYLLAFISGAIAQRGLIPPFLGAWLPNFFGLSAAALLIFRSSR